METVSQLLSRPLPLSTGRTAHVRLSQIRSFLYVLQTCAALDLTGLVPITDDASEDFIVGSELGLTGRFAKNLCDGVSKALSTTTLRHIKFGDYQASEPRIENKIPDVVMLSMPGCQSVAILEFKPWWGVRLESYPISRGYMYLVPLQSHLSQLVNYMRINMLKFGALSTYKTTVFVKRTDAYHFELSLPVDEGASNPTVRECLLAMAAFASEGRLLPNAGRLADKSGMRMNK
ncbi:hypothetical protein SI65_00960 [Aspergillus cristatus]|uniref:Uncharacterized protein n=1 Tax=Aspergillus cristatus TaxID=573508 RepID=A0A1E3BRG6_ASPCR|nr:hypothetical protein SI65_00960 [Aspergillus cristatus]